MKRSTRCMLRSICMSLAAFSFVASASAERIDVISTTFTVPMVEALAAAFEDRNPGVDVNLLAGPRSDDDMAQNLLRYKTVGDALPDLLVLGGNQRLLAESDITVPITELLAQTYPGLAAAPDVMFAKPLPDGKIYGIAFGLSMPVVLFNADLIQRAGGDPNNLPTDWKGILALAEKVNSLGSPVVGGFIEADNSGSLTLLYLLQSHGERMMNAGETKLTIDTPKAVEALSVLRGFGLAGQAKAAMSKDQARQAFGAGTIGVFVTMSSTIAAAEAAAGDRFKIRSVSFPATADGTIPTSRPMVSILTKDTEKYPVLLKFLDFAVSPEGQLIVAKTSGYFPTSQTSIDASPELTELLAARPNAHSVLDRLPKAVDWYVPPYGQGARVAKIVTDNLMQVVGLSLTPDEAVEAMTGEIAPLLEKAK